MFKKKNEIDTEGVNDLITSSRKIMKIMYILVIIAGISTIVYIGKQLHLFSFFFAILRVISPFFIGFVIAWLFNPLVNKMAGKNIPKVLGGIIVYVLIFIFIFLFVKLFIPIIYNQINEFIKILPNVITKITDFINNFFNKFEASGIDLSSTRDTILTNLQNITGNMAADLPKNIINSVVSLFSGLWEILIGLIIGFYMLIDFDNITNQLIKIIPRKHQREVVKLLNNVGVEVRKTVNGTLLVASMVFVCDTIGFAIVGLDAALLIGLFCGITDLIPYIGPYIGTGVAALLGFTQSPIIGIGVLIIAIIVQLLESYVLQPVVMSKATELHPVVIIVGLLVFGYLFGIIGMLVATPCLAIIKVIYRFFAEKYNFFNEKVKSGIEI